MTKVIDHNQKTLTETTYDEMNRPLTVTDGVGNTTTYTYTYHGKVETVTDPLNQMKEFAYNSRGMNTTMTYDAKGRLICKVSPEEVLNYLYDANDNLLNITDGEVLIIRTYDSLNRLTSRTDTNGNTIAYTYDDCGHITSITYPDNTVVTYGYDNNYNLTSVTDWANRTTEYEYDDNNRLTGVTKPNGCVTTTVYDDAGRVTSSVERSPVGAIVVGYEYTYDANSRIIEEKDLANSVKLCYTYDVLNRVTKRTTKSMTDDTVLSEETFAYDAAGNVTNANGETAQYSLNNRIMVFNGSGVGCDLDGNLTSLLFDGGRMNLAYDSKNRLTSAGNHTYTYDAEDVRIRNLCGDVDTTYAYDTNGKLSRLLMKTTNGVTTKYVYGLGLIGEQTGNSFKYYHFDSRGSTVALTGATGIVMDTFEYDTYGKVTARTGNTDVIFGYNGRYGVVTDENGLLYMRARYYSPEMRRFVNADILPGGISEAITLNRYAYANGNPVSFVDPFGLASVSNHHDRVGDYYSNSTAEEIYLIDELLNSLAGISQSTDTNSKKQTDPTLSLWADDFEGNFALQPITLPTEKEKVETDWDKVVQGILLFAIGTLTVAAVVVSGGACAPLAAAGYAVLGTAGVITTGIGLSEVEEGFTGDNSLKSYVGDNTYALLQNSSLFVVSVGPFIVEYGAAHSVCFVEGTPVSTENGTKPIEEIAVGESVWAEDPETREKTLKRVVQTFVNETSELVHVFVNGEEIVSTSEHPYYVAGKGWVGAAYLRVGDSLVLQSGETASVEGVQREPLDASVKVYNFEVEGFHTYYVGHSCVLVHNVCKGNWVDGGRGSPSNNANYHYNKHGSEVKAYGLDDYTRKATNFANDVLKRHGVKPVYVGGYTPDVFRYNFNRKYVELYYDGVEHFLVSFGSQNHTRGD